MITVLKSASCCMPLCRGKLAHGSLFAVIMDASLCSCMILTGLHEIFVM